MVEDNSSMFLVVMFCIVCGINSILSITSSMVGTQEADASFGVNMTIAVLNFLVGMVVLSTFLEERKKKKLEQQISSTENEQPSVETSSLLEIPPPYNSISFDNSIDSVDLANFTVLNINTS
jgi:hypothetical protein